MRLVGRGHDRIRATHAKTLELSLDTSITERATCVIAVATRTSGVLPLAGPIRIEISAGGESFALHANANSAWDPSGPAVVRRSGARLPGTLATDADAAASDLPADLVRALQSPQCTVEVTVRPDSQRPCGHVVLVLAWVDPTSAGADPALRAEVAAADLVVAEDDAARRILSTAGVSGDALITPGTGTAFDAGAGFDAAAAGHGRVLVVASGDLPGASVLDLLATPAGLAIEVVGLPTHLSAAAASPSRAPLVLGPASQTSSADLRALLRATAPAHRLVVALESGRLAAALSLARELRGRADAVVAQPYAQPVRVLDGRLPALPGKGVVFCCLDAVRQGADPVLDPAIRAAVNTLLADSVPTRTVARALAELTGWPRRRAYDAVLGMGREPPATGS